MDNAHIHFGNATGIIIAALFLPTVTAMKLDNLPGNLKAAWIRRKDEMGCKYCKGLDHMRRYCTKAPTSNNCGFKDHPHNKCKDPKFKSLYHRPWPVKAINNNSQNKENYPNSLDATTLTSNSTSNSTLQIHLLLNQKKTTISNTDSDGFHNTGTRTVSHETPLKINIPTTNGFSALQNGIQDEHNGGMTMMINKKMMTILQQLQFPL